MDILLNRRSCRKFIRGQKIPKNDLEHIIKTAQNYACSMGHQEVDFYVITNQEKIDSLSSEIHNATPEFKQFLDQRRTKYELVDTVWCDAPCVVFGIYNEESKNSSSKSRSETNCGIAMMNIIAEAESLGYATLPVLMASNPPQGEKTAKALGLPIEKLGLSVAIGKAAPSWKPEKKAEIQRVHYIQ